MIRQVLLATQKGLGKNKTPISQFKFLKLRKESFTLKKILI
ncbi:hypothetical protein P344_00845 [Spiroplasma mirum ATCC 29335]|uniref:Uncharacterized protein n=1 Tax=Spiroplasma mirum ATCC 29335 TaxID=838561 RepID=W6AK49_9MOLU|nr:hypothetical protein P344_00845 [Spiroplasma mirum ATCC 29335]